MRYSALVQIGPLLLLSTPYNYSHSYYYNRSLTNKSIPISRAGQRVTIDSRIYNRRRGQKKGSRKQRRIMMRMILFVMMTFQAMMIVSLQLLYLLIQGQVLRFVRRLGVRRNPESVSLRKTFGAQSKNRGRSGQYRRKKRLGYRQIHRLRLSVSRPRVRKGFRRYSYK